MNNHQEYRRKKNLEFLNKKKERVLQNQKDDAEALMAVSFRDSLKRQVKQVFDLPKLEDNKGNEPKPQDVHPLDKFVRHLANVRLMTCSAAIIFAVGILFGYLPQAGCLITIIGLFLMNSPMFIKGVYLSTSNAFGFASYEGESTEESRRIGRKVLWGMLYMVAGTVLWGFSDKWDIRASLALLILD